MLKNALLIFAILLLPTQHVNALEKIINGMPPSFDEYFNGNLSSYEQPLPVEKFNWLEPHKIEEMKFFETIPDHYEALVYDVAYLQILSFSFLLGIWVTPESISNWNRKDIIEDGFGAKWVQHVKEGPVVDGDGFFYNYIGHPLGGAYYYILARNNNLTIWESTFFTFLMSTLYWEYGFEAVFEIPSIQDLIITPLIGPLIGEGFYQLSLKIKANEGKVWGSEKFGSFLLVFFNPEGALADYLQTHKENIEFSFVANYASPFSEVEDHRAITGTSSFVVESYFGFIFRIKF